MITSLIPTYRDENFDPDKSGLATIYRDALYNPAMHPGWDDLDTVDFLLGLMRGGNKGPTFSGLIKNYAIFLLLSKTVLN